MEYACTNCSEIFQSSKEYLTHRKSHQKKIYSDKKHICHICRKAYARKTSLVYHLDTYHNVNNKNVFTFDCVFCPNFFFEL